MKKRTNRRTVSPAPAEAKAGVSLATFLRTQRLNDILLAGSTALLVTTPLIPSEATIQGVQTPINLLWLLVLLGWSVQLLLRRETVIRLGWFEVALLALVAWNVVSGLLVGMQANGRQTLNSIWQWIAYGVIVLMLRQFVRTPQQQRALAAVMIGLAATLATHAFYQYFYSMEQMRARYERNPEMMLAESAWPIQGTSPVRTLIENRVRSVEPLATFALTNSLAGYIAPWLLFSLGIGLGALSAKRFREVVAAACISIYLASCLFLTKSRTAVLATAGGIVLLLLYGPRRGWRIGWKLPVVMAAVAVVLGLATVYVGGLDVQVLSEAPLSVRYRLEYWRATAAMIADHPLLGIGPGNFQEYYSHYKLPQSSETIQDPHNFILEIWAAGGTPALLLLLGVAGAFVYEQWKVGAAAANHSEGTSSETLPVSATAKTAKADVQDHFETSPVEKVRWIFAGGVLGVLIAFPIGLINGYPPEIADYILLPVPVLLGLPVAAIAVWALRGWVQGGELHVSLPVIALIALLVNLLAAGAVMFPGVINTVWVLAVLALPLATAGKPTLHLGAQTAAVPVLISIVILFAFMFTQYRPVLNARLYIAQGDTFRTLGNLEAADAWFVRAAEADPWAVEPRRNLFDLRLQRWYELQTDANWRAFEEATAPFLAADPQFYGQYESAALSYQSAAGARPSPERRQRVVELLQQAVERYPNGAHLHAQLAWALHRAGRDDEARREAEEALRLDSLHNHSEQKLSALHLYDPGAPDVNSEGVRPETIEQSMEKLRNR